MVVVSADRRRSFEQNDRKLLKLGQVLYCGYFSDAFRYDTAFVFRKGVAIVGKKLR